MHATDDPGDEDLLVCGTCQRDFPLKKITTFMQHKKFDCDDQPELEKKSSTLLCQSCPEQFGSPWRLLKHAQGVHSLRIYQEQGRIIQEQLELAVPRIPDVKWEGGTSGLLLSAQPTSLQKTVPQIVLPSSAVAGSTQWRQSILTVNKADIVDVHDPKQQECWEPKTNDPNCPVLDTRQTDGPAQPLVVDTEAPPAEEAATTSESSSAVKQETEAEDEQICCNDQNCGITLMPLTHEGLKKCCSAVLPKKRKRHMEIKHLTSVARSRLKKYSSAMKRRAQPPASQTAPSIYIDLEPHNESLEKPPQHETEQRNTDQYRPSTSNVSAEITTSSHYVSATTRTLPMTQKSVIIQPGSTFSIPVPYSIGSQPLIAFTTHHGDPGSVSSSVSPTIGPAVLSVGHPASATVSTQPSSVVTQMPMTKELLKKETKQLQLPVSASEARRDLNNVSPTDASGGRGKKRRYPTSRPYKCDQCDNAFNQRIHLKKHQSKHTGVKPYKCEQCDYSTVERSHLKVHIRVHTGEKPFRCTYCEYATAQNSTLKIHLKRHHNYSLSYSCDTCGKKFAEEELYQTHTREHQKGGTATEAGQAQSGTSPQEVSLLTPGANLARSHQPSQLVPWTATATATSPLHTSPEGVPPETLHLAVPATQQQGHSPCSSVSHSPVTVEESSAVAKSAGTDLP